MTDYIVEQNFLSTEMCNKLKSYCEQILDANANVVAVNVNPMYNNRVVYYESIRDPEIKQILKTIHDSVAQKLKDFYHLEQGTILYPEATHLVRWPTGSGLGYHADNAYEDGMPNYVSWRTHSAVIYLNEDFEGGRFYFKKEYPQMHTPKTGLLMAFTGGLDHVHAVETISSGTRYALPMWFCTDPKYAYV